MKIRYLTIKKRLLTEIEYNVSPTMLPRIGETIVGFGDSYEVTNVCYFFHESENWNDTKSTIVEDSEGVKQSKRIPGRGWEIDHINVTLISESVASRRRYLETDPRRNPNVKDSFFG